MGEIDRNQKPFNATFIVHWKTGDTTETLTFGADTDYEIEKTARDLANGYYAVLRHPPRNRDPLAIPDMTNYNFVGTGKPLGVHEVGTPRRNTIKGDYRF